MRQLELIWKYIDGNISEEEKEIFISALKNDEFAEEFEKAKILNKQLSENHLISAPVGLIDQTIAKISKETEIDLSNINSISTRPFWYFLTSIIFIPLVFYWFTPISSESSLPYPNLDISNYINLTQIDFAFEMNYGIIAYGLMALLMIPIAHFMEHLIIKPRMI